MQGPPASTVTLRLRVVRSTDGLLREWCVRVPAGTSWTQVAGDLHAPDPVYVGSARLDAEAVVGIPPLVNETVVCDVGAPLEPPHLLELVATEGPCVGARAVMTGACVVVGRASENHLVLQDDDLSRHHCELQVEQGRAVVRDLCSTNGTWIDGSRIGPDFVDLRVGQRLRVGGTTLAIERAARASQHPPTDGTGRYLIHRSPRKTLRLDEVELTAPLPPELATHRGFPWVSAIVPLVLAAAMVVVLRNPLFAMFALLSPIMVAAQYAGDRSTSHRQLREDSRAHTLARARFEEDCASAVRVEQALRRQMAPPITRAAHDAASRSSAVWHRAATHEDHLAFRVGVGTVQSRVRVAGGNRATRPLPVHEVPITVSLSQHRVVGVSGCLRYQLVMGGIIQLAAWQSPRDLGMVILCADQDARERWRGMTTLPQVLPHPAAQPRVMVADPDDPRFAEWCSQLVELDGTAPPRSLVVLDGCATTPIAADVVRRAAAYGMAVLALDEDHTQLPAACTTTVRVDRRDHGRVGDTDFRPDLPVPSLVTATARALGALTDAGPDDPAQQVPEQVAHAALVRAELGVDLSDPVAVQRLWGTPSSTPRALLGVGAEGALWVDLAVDGPHALVAGTTGAGKSELLQTLIASLALASPPDRLTFVLIDYKGGAAFQDCARLPHTLGLVTDLDTHLTSRALRSLEAEVRRRERLLAAVGASDLGDYERSTHREPLARLCIVIDEFRVLSEELPDFINGLVRIAAVGRSLGIHLVLATQRPAGVVSADMRANLNLRIALRVRDAADSQDVIETDAAAAIPASLPGRAILRTGGGAPRALQTAWTGATLRGGDEPVRIARVDPESGAPLWPPDDMGANARTGLRALTDAVCVSAANGRVRRPASPWLPPLPSRVGTSDLTAKPLRDMGLRDAARSAVPLGLVDLPSQQQQPTIGWDIDADGHLAIVGGPRSGRTTAAHALIGAAATVWASDRLHVYVLDGSGGLSDIGSLPHCGAVVLRDELSRTLRLVQWLTNVIRERQLRYSGTGFTTSGPDPRILLVIDGWEVFQEISNEHTVGDLEDRITQVLRDGVSVGVGVVATGGRALLSGRVSALFTSTVATRMADPSDLLMAGLRAAQIPAEMPPGRGLLLPGGEELQFALPGDARTNLVAAPNGRPHRVEALPDRVELATLIAADPGVVTLGCTVDGPAGFAIDERGGAGWLVCGPPRSGRTTTLAVLAEVLGLSRAVGWIRPGAPVGGLPPAVTRLPYDDLGAVRAWCAEHPDGAVLVDDADQLTGMAAEPAVLEHLARHRTTGGIVCASGVASDLATSYRGLAPELRRRQTGLLLQPGRHDGDLFGIRIGPMDRPRQGRGLLVVRGDVLEIQVATP
ncbi:FtsK/SpoIIIE domain-containing protein [Allobranchiibius sp. GilTou38]|uniref:FtsK/SpoIIIE domain-containing protein n=1 Tax=Allobranchiibius sp. GilTou38 TaxID=2815210 RepID=UPI001AA1C2B0|nr:FtsK/SpoIIIE domain-containing protein [Allobranchiibius sp. GilTou38]MBO1765807.1 FHA domain-containing protein [Allobranchiibius sp. GilTou38]